MDRLEQLGEIFSTLRSVSGLAIGDVARAVGCDESTLREAERGDLDDALTTALAECYGLDAEALRAGLVGRGGEASAAVFLFHGAATAFDVRDLPLIERAMQTARVYTATTQDGRRGIEARARFRARPPSGPAPADAAMQGHALAREVRAALEVAHAPLGDLRALLEERFGAVVLVDAFVSYDLRALATLDAARACAATVLGADDPQRAQNPLLARVYLAHELCHLLFDPVRPGRVQIAADLVGTGASTRPDGSASVEALMESRARGFAAEFLIPQRGVEQRLGAPGAPIESMARALPLIQETIHHFATPKEIAVWHLINLGYVARRLSNELIAAHISNKSTDTTTLPAPGAHPEHLRTRFATSVEAMRQLRGDEGPRVAADARRMAAEAAATAAAALLAQAYAEADGHRPVAATDLLVERLDGALSAGDAERVVAVLRALDPTRLPPEVLTGVLMVTRPARGDLGAARADFFARVLGALRDHWNIGEDRVARIEARLR
jgi:Zn-dependent peptidase ImmA (M78 family)